MTDQTGGPEPGVAREHIYSPMFERFVDDVEDRVLGMIAYGIYEEAKREWVIDTKERKARPPTEEEEAEYVRTWTETRVRNALESAAQTMATFADSVISQEKPNILRDALRGSFWRSIGYSVAGAAIYTLLLIATAVILTNAGVDIASIFRTVGDGGQIEETAP